MSQKDGFPGQRLRVLPRPLMAASLLRGDGDGLLPSDVGFFPEAHGHERHRPFGAGELILAICLRGRGWIETVGRRHPVGAGEIAVLAPGIGHAYGADQDDPWSIAWIHVAGERARRWAAAHADPAVRRLADPVRCAALVDEVYALLSRDPTPAVLAAAGGVCAHLLGLIALPATDAADPVARAEALMRADLARPWAVPALARQVGLSSSQLTARFRTAAGLPPLAWLLRARMQIAAEMLATSGLGIADVAARLGYDDPFYFSRRFRAVHGVAPRRWRAASLISDAGR